MPAPTPMRLQLGPYTLDTAAAQLILAGRLVALRPKACLVLAALAARSRELVSKDALLDAVWGRRFITEGVIKSAVGELRTALADAPRLPRWIETVPRRGYRCIGPVEVVGPASDAPPALGAVLAGIAPPVGRDAEIALLDGLLQAQRALAVTGPSGVGKTRVVLALAQRWAQRPAETTATTAITAITTITASTTTTAPAATAAPTAVRDGVWFIELASLQAAATDDSALCAVIAQTLHLAPAAGRDAAALARALAPLHGFQRRAPSCLELEHHLSGSVGVNTLVGQGRAVDVAAQLLQRLAVVSPAAHGSVKIEAVDVGAQRLLEVLL